MAHSHRVRHAFYLLLALWLTAPTIPARAQVPATDSLTMMALYTSTNGPSWTGAAMFGYAKLISSSLALT